MHFKEYRAVLYCISILIAGCTDTIIKAPTLGASINGTIAVLPVSTASDIQREKLTYLQKAFSRELSSSGYSVLNEKTVNEVCRTEGCPERTDLVHKYSVDNFVEISLTSSEQANFLAGYYNVVSGTVRLLNASNEQLLSIDHSENERGGILFNSGQVLEAFTSASRGFEDSSQELSDRFVKKVIAQLPKADQRVDRASGKPVEIKKIEVFPLGQSRYRVCAEATPGMTARLVLRGLKYPLRETRQGSYCSVLLLALASQRSEVSRIVVESPYGLSKQKELTFPDSILCNPASLVYRNGSASLSINCRDGDGKEQCLEDIKSCKSTQFFVYKSESADGPFTKAGKVVGESWKDIGTAARSSGDVSYAVLALSPDGASSVPFQIK